MGIPFWPFSVDKTHSMKFQQAHARIISSSRNSDLVAGIESKIWI
jgi:hypothetical protein